MKSKDIRRLSDQLTGRLQEKNPGQARDALHDAFVSLLKMAYMQIRSQASPATLRGLLEWEIKIGGESADFRAFDRQGMVDLFVRGVL